jgi:hypothetical protein
MMTQLSWSMGVGSAISELQLNSYTLISLRLDTSPMRESWQTWTKASIGAFGLNPETALVPEDLQ